MVRPKQRVCADTQHGLEQELKVLKQEFSLNCELNVVLAPRDDSNLLGEVKGKTIYIYTSDQKEAVETLRHEFLDYMISRVAEPYKEMVNKLVSLINEQAYQTKEIIVDSILRLIFDRVQQ